MFHGSSQINLDSKGRLAIPAKYREKLLGLCDGRLIVTADPDHCLLIYPKNEWEPIQKKLMGLPSFDPTIRAMQRLLVGYAEDVEMDGAGRVLVSSALREYSGIEKRVMLAGQGNRLELWEEGRWLEQQKAIGSLANGMPAGLEGFSL